MRKPHAMKCQLPAVLGCLAAYSWALGASIPPVLTASQPNFLVVLADDCTYNDLPLYGGQNARTPHLDSLAAEGLTFNRAYLAMSMCQPPGDPQPAALSRQVGLPRWLGGKGARVAAGCLPL